MASLVDELDGERIIQELNELGLEPLSKGNLQHMACEMRKAYGERSTYSARPLYRELFEEVQRLELELRVVSGWKRRRLARRATT